MELLCVNNLYNHIQIENKGTHQSEQKNNNDFVNDKGFNCEKTQTTLTKKDIKIYFRYSEVVNHG